MVDIAGKEIGVLGRAVVEGIGRNWGWLLALGIICIVLGVIGLGWSVLYTVASVLVIGAFLLIGGVIQAIDAFQHSGWKSTLWHVLIALLYIVVGAMILWDPVGSSIALTLVIAAFLVASGVMRAIMAFQMRPMPGWGWLLAGAVLSIVLGVLIFAGWPVSGLWVIGMFVAIELLINGWSYVMIALAAKRVAHGATAVPA